MPKARQSQIDAAESKRGLRNANRKQRLREVFDKIKHLFPCKNKEIAIALNKKSSSVCVNFLAYWESYGWVKRKLNPNPGEYKLWYLSDDTNPE